MDPNGLGQTFDCIKCKLMPIRCLAYEQYSNINIKLIAQVDQPVCCMVYTAAYTLTADNMKPLSQFVCNRPDWFFCMSNTQALR